MSFLYVTEYYAGSVAGIQAPPTPPLVRQPRLDFTDGQPHQSAAFSADTRMVEVTCDAICSVVVGTNLTATASDSRFYAGRVHYFTVKAGDKVSVIANT